MGPLRKQHGLRRGAPDAAVASRLLGFVSGGLLLLAACSGSTTRSGESGDPTTAEEAERPDDAPVGRVVPIGTELDVTYESVDGFTGSSWLVTVDQAGEDITAEVLDGNEFNQPPEPGYLFYGVPVTVRLVSAEDEPESTWFRIDFDFFGMESGRSMPDGGQFSCGVVPDALDFQRYLYAGDAVSGTVCRSVSMADFQSGVLLQVRNLDGVYLESSPPESSRTTTTLSVPEVDDADLAYAEFRRAVTADGYAHLLSGLDLDAVLGLIDLTCDTARRLAETTAVTAELTRQGYYGFLEAAALVGAAKDVGCPEVLVCGSQELIDEIAGTEMEAAIPEECR